MGNDDTAGPWLTPHSLAVFGMPWPTRSAARIAASAWLPNFRLPTAAPCFPLQAAEDGADKAFWQGRDRKTPWRRQARKTAHRLLQSLPERLECVLFLMI
jgi:hypothetical protein